MSLAGQVSTLAARVAAEIKAVRAEIPARAGTPGVVTLTDAATVAVPVAVATGIYRLTAAGNRIIAAPTGATDGQRILLQITASGADRTITLTTGAAGAFAFGTNITSIPVVTSGTTTFIGAIYRTSSARWHVLAVSSGH